MRRHSFLCWAFAGLISAALGWAVGGLLGSFLPRTIVAITATTLTFGLLAFLPRTALLATAVSGLVAAGAFLLGGRLVTPLLVWPASALVIGLFARPLLSRGRAKFLVTVAAPFLGGAGYLAGVLLVILFGFGLDDARLTSQFMWGGAAGFGLVTLGGFRAMSRWLDRESTGVQ